MTADLITPRCGAAPSLGLGARWSAAYDRAGDAGGAIWQLLAL